jgi:NADPH2:quinone reductase
VQLAVQGGAEVIAIAGDRSRAETIEALGLDRVTIEIGLQPKGRGADLILESAGGESLSAAMRRVTAGGTVVTLGRSSRESATISPGWFFRNARLQGLSYITPDEPDRSAVSLLGGLCRLVAESKLDPGVGLEVGWRDVDQAMRQLLDRKVSGKAVVHIVPDQ